MGYFNTGNRNDTQETEMAMANTTHIQKETNKALQQLRETFPKAIIKVISNIAPLEYCHTKANDWINSILRKAAQATTSCRIIIPPASIKTTLHDNEDFLHIELAASNKQQLITFLTNSLN